MGKLINTESPQEKKRRLALKKKWDIEHPDRDDNPYARAPKNIRLDDFLESERWDEIDSLLYLQSNQDEGNHASESKAKIRRFVNTFSKEEKFLYNAYYVKEMSYKEISENTGLSEETVRWRMKRIKDKIHTKFEASNVTKSKKSRTRLVKGHESRKGEESGGK